jgi:4-hydroxy-tetrahydrodipicolinate synthase
MITPFDEEGGLDLDGAVHLARWLLEHGNDFLVLTGSTGESAVLTDAEKADLWRAVSEAVTGPVVAGTSTYDTAHSVELTRMAQAAGVDGILAVTPPYNRPSQAGIEAHMRAIAGAAGGLPVLLYNIPVRTGRLVTPEVILRLFHDGAIVGTKDAVGNIAGSADLIAHAPSDFECYSGNDGDTLPLLAVGGVGVISVESHWAGPEMSEMIAAFLKGDIDTAREINARLVASHRFQSTDDAPNPVPTKAMLRTLGLPAGECRLPMGPTPEGLEGQARTVYAQLHG